MLEVDVYKLGDITINHDARRVPVRAADRIPGPFPYFGASGIVDHVDGYLFDGEYLLVAEDGENLRTRKTPIAFMATGKFWVNNHAHVLTGNERANTRYLSYVLANTEISGFLSGSTQPKLTQAALNSIPVRLPKRDYQDVVIRILGALDEKILINERSCRISSDLAAALFVSSFEQGNAQRVSLGEIAEIVDCLHAKKPELVDGSDFRYLVLADIRVDGRLEAEPRFSISHADYAEWVRRIEVRGGDCVVTNVGRVGAVAQVPDGAKAAIGRNMTAIRGRFGVPSAYLIEALKSFDRSTRD